MPSARPVSYPAAYPARSWVWDAAAASSSTTSAAAPAAADAPAAPAAADKKISLKIKKIIFIVDYDPSSSSVQENITITREDLIIEEFLNLYYINYFSFDNDKFTQKYTQFIKPPALQSGGSTLVKKKRKKQNSVK